MDRRTDQQAYFPIEMQFYISAMFLGFTDEIDKEKPSFLDFENNWLPTDGRTDGRMDGQTDRPSYRDAWTHLKTLTSPILMNIKTEPDKLETSACAHFKDLFKTFPNLL